MNKSVLIVNPSPVNIGNEYHYQLFAIVRKFAQKVDLIGYSSVESTDILSKLSQNYSHIFISGSSSINDPSIDSMPLIKQKYDWVTKTSVSILGVCMGHQILGYLHGSKVIHDTEKERGTTLVKKNKLSEVLSGLDKKFSMHQEHRDSISIPDDFILLASSIVCKNQAMKHKDKNIFGFQAHPKLSGENGERIIRNFLGIYSS